MEKTVLNGRDIIDAIKLLVELRNGRGEIDDIDHLVIGELDVLEN